MLIRVKRTGSESIGEILRIVRNAKGLTIQQLSEQSGINTTTISRMENDKRRPNINTYFKLLNTLGADVYIMY